MERKGFFTRLLDLWRGFWGVRLNGAEARNAELVYHNAIQQRAAQHVKLKDAVARLVYLRNRIEADMRQREDDLRLVDKALLRAATADDDDKALGLIRKKRLLDSDIERLRGEHERLLAQAESAKEGLAEVAKAVKHLKAERSEMLARKTHAVARLEVASALQQSNGNFAATDQALENVREAIVRLEHRADIGVEADFDASGEVSIAALRRAEEDESDEMALTALKHRLGKKLLAEGFTEPTISAVAPRVEAVS